MHGKEQSQSQHKNSSHGQWARVHKQRVWSISQRASDINLQFLIRQNKMVLQKEQIGQLLKRLNARCRLRKFWAEAVNTAVYLKNHFPHKVVKGKTSEEIWTGRKVDLSHLKVFGCLVYVHILKNLRNK